MDTYGWGNNILILLIITLFSNLFIYNDQTNDNENDY